MTLATDRAGYKLRDSFDQDVLGYVSVIHGMAQHGQRVQLRLVQKLNSTAGNDELLAANKLTKVHSAAQLQQTLFR